MKGKAKRGDQLAFGDFGIQALGSAWITSSQIEAARVAITRNVKRRGKVWIRIFPQKPVSKKPAETRMGKGKGATEFWVAVVKSGTIMFEMSGVSVNLARESMSLADAKMPIPCRFVSREEIE